METKARSALDVWESVVTITILLLYNECFLGSDVLSCILMSPASMDVSYLGPTGLRDVDVSLFQ